MNQQLALEMLRRLGYHADVVENGYEALEALARRSYAAVLMDCYMPGMDGFSAAAEIRRREAGASAPSPAPVPIIAMTASAMQGDRERCLAAGMTDYLAKPIRLHDLAAILERWIPDVGGPGLDAEEDDQTASGAPATAHARNDVIDASVLAKLYRLDPAGQPHFVKALIAQFLEDAPRVRAELEAAARRKDPEALWRTAHSLRADSATMGAHEVAAACAALERLGRSGTTLGSLELLEVLDATLGRAKAALEAAGVRGAA